MKRYNMLIPEELYGEVERIAEERQTTVIAVLRSFIKLGLMVADAEKSPNKDFLIREDGKETYLVLL